MRKIAEAKETRPVAILTCESESICINYGECIVTQYIPASCFSKKNGSLLTGARISFLVYGFLISVWTVLLSVATL